MSEVRRGGRRSGDALEGPPGSPSAAAPLSGFPALWSSRETFSEMRRLGGTAGRLFFVGTGGAGVFKGLAAAPGFISSSTQSSPPLAPGDRLPTSRLRSEAILDHWDTGNLLRVLSGTVVSDSLQPHEL